ncbi:hypothetical protein CW751_08360 [Brumimicrobium salinarum]|uniref:Translocation and assembly module TamB C-terminal domain-containing protein n=1 Tax=Brumimicrobium salinarum TaxID=2058658 RepID=A0A2I0R2G1_9FLAO|nr:translocation/assembly module TamB domain-containing protein [Brumimicrobium salinarum]PKR80774.1 hypothetical protein CW751_08360 [Brumimicrobium salinarum]
MEEKVKKKHKKRPWWKRGLRILAWFATVLVALFIIIVLIVRSEWGQRLIVGEATQFITAKTDTEFSIDKLFITFSGDIYLEGLYLEDLQKDTLLYSKSLQAGIPIWPIIMGNPIAINGVEWNGLRANVHREDSISGYNFQFLIDAFSSESTSETEKSVEEQEQNSESPKIQIGTIHFSNFKVNYHDEVTGMAADLQLGAFNFKGKNFDLNKMQFEVEQIALKNTDIKYVQNKPIPPSTDTTSTELPFINVDELKLENVNAYYQSIPDGLEATANLNLFKINVPAANLSNQEIEINEIILDQSFIDVKISSTQVQPRKETQIDTIGNQKDSLPSSFEWPDWKVDINRIAFTDNQIHYTTSPNEVNSAALDPNNIQLADFNFITDKISLTKEETAQFKLESLSFKEKSGVTINNFQFDAHLEQNKLGVTAFNLVSGQTNLVANIDLAFPSINKIIQQPEQAELDIRLSKIYVELKDIFTILPELKENEYLQKLSKHPIESQLYAKGSIKKMKLSKFELLWGSNTAIHTNGQFLNLTDTESLYADIDNLTIQTQRIDIAQLVETDSLGISIPEKINIQSKVKGGLSAIETQTKIQVPEGKINLDGGFKNNNQLSFNGKLSVIDLALGKIINNPSIGIVAFDIEAQGKGNNLQDLNAELRSDFSHLEFNNYDFSALELDGQLKNGKGDINLCFKDDHLNLTLDTQLDLDTLRPEASIDLNVKGANLMALGLTKDNIKSRLSLQSELKGNSDQFKVTANISEGVIVSNKDNYYLGPVIMAAELDKDGTSMDVKSNFLNLALRANAGPEKISKSIQDHLTNYFADSIARQDSISNPVQLSLDLDFTENELFSSFLVPELKTMDTLNLTVNFNESKNDLSTTVSLPYLNYAGNTIDSLKFKIDAKQEDAMFRFGFKALKADPIAMNQTYFDGDLKNGNLNLHFHSFEGEEELYIVKTEISGKNNNLKIHFLPEPLKFNGETWSIPKNNELTIQKDQIIAKEFKFTKGNQSIGLANDLISRKENNIGIGFKNFKLQNLLALFNDEELLASGDLNGNIVAIDPLDKLGLNADLKIDNLKALQAEIGQLNLSASSKTLEDYNVDLSIQGNHLDIDVNGDYKSKVSENQLDFVANLHQIDLETIAALSNDNLTNASGNISGKIELKGNISSPIYDGFIQFNQAEMNVTQLNSKFKLANERIGINNEKISFKQFSIADQNNNKFALNGDIQTNDFSNPSFNIGIKANNFQAINSTKKDNEVFYGDLNFDMNGDIKGDLNAPFLDLNLAINEKTDFTYALQDAQAQLEKRDGVIEFVNKENPDNILTANEDSTNIVAFGGIEVHAKLKVEQGAEFNVIVDPKTGDNLNVSGAGDLIFNLEKNGRTTLSGKYTIDKGHYNLSLYNLVKREFEFEPGSSISWSGGDPMDADLDVTASYSVKASASALMAAQTAGASEEVRNKYRQQLPFFVYLNVNGEIDQPQLNFNLGMPEESKGAIDGTVYSRIRQINNQEDALNKQVFSLLVLKKFYPNPGSDGSSGGTASLVRKNINQAISDQLNAYSDKLMGNSGVELNFGLDSYTDYQGETADQRTDLNVSAQKKLLDDRLIVEVGSTVNVEGDAPPGQDAVVGNASIQYLITEDGRWRIKGYRDSEYQNVIDGQVFVNGIALIFQRQFNHFEDLFGDKKQKKNPEDQKDKSNSKTKSDINQPKKEEE